jgi:hypothetical protein
LYHSPSISRTPEEVDITPVKKISPYLLLSLTILFWSGNPDKPLFSEAASVVATGSRRCRGFPGSSRHRHQGQYYPASRFEFAPRRPLRAGRCFMLGALHRIFISSPLCLASPVLRWRHIECRHLVYTSIFPLGTCRGGNDGRDARRCGRYFVPCPVSLNTGLYFLESCRSRSWRKTGWVFYLSDAGLRHPFIRGLLA